MRDINDLSKIIKERLDEVKKKLSEDSTLQPIADEMLKTIVTRTKAGYGVEEFDKPKIKLAPLSTSYKNHRKKNKGELGDKASATKSNLTLSGKMLRRLKAFVKSGKIFILPIDELTKDKIDWNANPKAGTPKRVFLNLSDKEVKYYRKKLLDLVKSIIFFK